MILQLPMNVKLVVVLIITILFTDALAYILYEASKVSIRVQVCCLFRHHLQHNVAQEGP